MDVEKTMQFLLEWQAQFSASLDQMKEEAGRRAAEVTAALARNADAIGRTAEIVGKLGGQVAAINDHILVMLDTMDHTLTVEQDHVDWLSRLTESQLRLEAMQTKLAEAEARNADAINSLLGRLPKQ